MKKFLSLVLALIMVLSMASFASAEQGSAAVVGLAGDPGNIGPFQGMGLGRIGILFTTYEMLMVKDGSEFRGCLMKELTQVDDLTYDVELYDYIVDHLYDEDIVDKDKLNDICLDMYVSQIEKVAKAGKKKDRSLYLVLKDNGYNGWTLQVDDDTMKKILGDLAIPEGGLNNE